VALTWGLNPSGLAARSAGVGRVVGALPPVTGNLSIIRQRAGSRPGAGDCSPGRGDLLTGRTDCSPGRGDLLTGRTDYSPGRGDCSPGWGSLGPGIPKFVIPELFEWYDKVFKQHIIRLHGLDQK